MLLRRLAITSALLCSSAFGLATAAAATTTFSYTGSLQTYSVTTTGLYDITLAGGQGGANAGAWDPSGNPIFIGGGAGAFVGGDVWLTAGTTLDIVVGGQGANGFPYKGGWGSSGGGGSWVLTSAGGLLAVAGGGGGADLVKGNGQPGTTSAAGAGNGGLAGAGFDGFGDESGGGGAGWLGDGATAGYLSGGGGSGYPSFAGGLAWTLGITGPSGAYGGSGAGGYIFGGGGGGYTGGNGDGGGGTSYLDPGFSNVTAIDGENFGAGLVTISAVAGVPETSTWAMMLAGFAGLGFAGYRRNKGADLAA